VLASLTAPGGVRAILEHLELPTRPAKRAPAQGLPQLAGWDDTANDWLGQINHAFGIDFPLVDMSLAPTAVARMATYELSGGNLEKWTNTAYYANSWQPKINRYLQYVRHGWRLRPTRMRTATARRRRAPLPRTTARPL
jgi:hypothetical protein